MHDSCVLDGAEETACRLLEIARVGEGQRREHRLVLRDHGMGGVFRLFLRRFTNGCLAHDGLLTDRNWLRRCAARQGESTIDQDGVAAMRKKLVQMYLLSKLARSEAVHQLPAMPVAWRISVR